MQVVDEEFKTAKDNKTLIINVVLMLYYKIEM